MTMIDGSGYDHVAFITSDEGEISGNKVLYVIFRLNSMKIKLMFQKTFFC